MKFGVGASSVRARFVGLVGLVAAVAVACSDPPKSTPDAGAAPGGLTEEQAARVLARIGDRTITLGDFAAALDRMDQFDRLKFQATDRRKDLLNQMIDVELLAEEAKRRGLDKEPATEEAIRAVLRDAYLVEAHKALPTPAEIPADEVKAYFEGHVADYRDPERRRVSVIVLEDKSPEDEKRATDALASAKSATSAAEWSKLFFELSTTAPKERIASVPTDLAGDVGMVGPPDDPKGENDDVPLAVRAAAFKVAKVGDVFDGVVRADGKLYIVRVSAITPGRERSLAEADRSIRQLLLGQRLRALEDKLEQDLRQKFKVEIDEAALDKLSTAPAPSSSSKP
ncbi:MAG: peptidylprolyl isomerase [Polyangiaceae bacterium]